MPDVEPDGNEFLSVPQVAALAQCHPDKVRRAIARGRLLASCPGKQYRIRRAVVYGSGVSSSI